MLTPGMNMRDPAFDDEGAPIRSDLRQQIAALLLDRANTISWDAVGVLPFTSGTEQLDAEYCHRVGIRLGELLAFAIRDGRLEARSGLVADLHRMVLERSLPIEQLFTFVYLLERTALDELALSDTIGATAEPWPLVAQLVRRGSFELLASYVSRAQAESSEAALFDRLTTVHTRAMFDAVLAKELERAGRFGTSISLILFDVDHLSAINQEFGYGVGDKILERLGILIRQYFRQHDWVARHSEDSIAVLLTRTDADVASDLAEQLRATVQERLGFTDHRSDRTVDVTVSAAVVNVNVSVGEVIDPERLVTDAEAVLQRSKQLGRNRVERIDGYSGYASRSS